MILEQKEMVKKANAAFDDFYKQMEQSIGSWFTKRDIVIFRNLFVNGYMKALDDLVQMGKNKTS